MNQDGTRLHGGRLPPDGRTRNRREATGTRPTDLLPHLPKPDLARVYYRARDDPIMVPTLREELELSKSSAYSYIDELVDAGLLVEVADSQGAT